MRQRGQQEGRSQARDPEQQQRAAPETVRQRAQQWRAQELAGAVSDRDRAVPVGLRVASAGELADQDRHDRNDQADADHVDQRRHLDERDGRPAPAHRWRAVRAFGVSRGRNQKGPVASHRSICGSRSWPQNGSPSTNMNGAPNTPRASAESTCSLSRSLTAVCWIACRAAPGSTPTWRNTSASTATSEMLRPAAKYARTAACTKLPARGGSVSLSQSSARAGATVDIGKVSGSRNGTLAKRALRSKSRLLYSPFSGTSGSGRMPETLKATPSSIGL